MIERIKRLIRDYENGQTQLDEWDLALMIKEIAEERVEEGE